MGLESWISSPCLCDRRPSLISAHGSKNHDSISQILNPAAEKYQAFKTKTPFLCHCEGAKRPKLSIKKVDSSMDRHALQSKARDDREKADSRKNEQSNNSTPARRILRFCDDFGGFQAVGAGIYLEW